MFQTTTGDGAHRHDGGLNVRAPPMAGGGGRFIIMVRADGTEVAKLARDVTVMDRSFLFPGMPVVSASDPGGQIGVVTGVATALDLFRFDEPTAVVATGVSPAEVRRVRELTLGDYVVSGTWLGRVVEVSIDVDVLFGDGSVCRVTRAGDRLRVHPELRRRRWQMGPAPSSSAPPPPESRLGFGVGGRCISGGSRCVWGRWSARRRWRFAGRRAGRRGRRRPGGGGHPVGGASGEGVE
ncbi:unnamed protein product [Urochloa humidicola]